MTPAADTAERDVAVPFASLQVGQDPSQIYVAGNGNIWTAPIDTTLPAAAPTTPWVNNGFATEDGVLFTFGRTVDQIKGWQSFDPLRMIVTEAPKTVKFTLMQSTAANIILALGGGTVSATGPPPNLYSPPAPQALTMNALYINAIDGANTWAFYCPRAMITDNVEVPWKKSGEAQFALTFTIQAAAAGKDTFNFVFPTSFGTS